MELFFINYLEDIWFFIWLSFWWPKLKSETKCLYFFSMHWIM